MAERAARVLIADDDPFTRDILSRFLADFIYKPFDLEYLETSLLAKLLTMGKP